MNIDIKHLSQILNAHCISNSLRGIKKISINDINGLSDKDKEFLKLIGDDKIIYSYIKTASLYNIMNNYINNNKNKLTFVNWSNDAEY